MNIRSMTKMLVTAGILCSAISFHSCKVGENDPLLTLKSRDARIAGTWELTDWDYTYRYTDYSNGTTTIETTTRTYDGDILTITFGTNVVSYSFSWKMTINEDGSYTRIITEDGDREEETGYWWWLDSGEEKSRIAFDDDYNSFEIDQLKDDEMILIMDYSNKYTYDNGEYEKEESTSTMTFTKE